MTQSGHGYTPRMSEGILSALFVSMEEGIGLSSLKTLTSSTKFIINITKLEKQSKFSLEFHQPV